MESFDQLSLDLKAAYQNKDISDVICLIGIERITRLIIYFLIGIYVGKNEIPVYGIKAILAARSKYEIIKGFK